MSGIWRSILTELIPLALVVALSPLSIIPGILVLHSPRPKPTGLAFLAGWVIGLAVLTSIFLTASNLAGGIGKSPPSWASWLRIIIGVALIGFGIYRWVTRKKSEHMPGWMTKMSTLTPGKAAVTGAVLTVANVKVLFISAAAGLAIGSSGLTQPSVWVVVIWYVVVASSTVAIPILGYAISGDSLDSALERLKAWMERQHASLVAVILVVIGLLVLYKGIKGL